MAEDTNENQKETKSVESEDGTRINLIDAFMAFIVLVIVTVIAYLEGIEPSPIILGLVVLGAVGMFVFEFISSYYYDQLRDFWESYRLPIVSLTVGILFVALEISSQYTIPFFVGALGSYLMVFVLVWTEKIPPPKRW